MLLHHLRLGENEIAGHMRYKFHGPVHRIQIDGIVQKEKIRLIMGVPFHLTDDALLRFLVHRVEGLLIEPAKFWWLDHPIVRSISGSPQRFWSVVLPMGSCSKHGSAP